MKKILLMFAAMAFLAVGCQEKPLEPETPQDPGQETPTDPETPAGPELTYPIDGKQWTFSWGAMGAPINSVFDFGLYAEGMLTMAVDAAALVPGMTGMTPYFGGNYTITATSATSAEIKMVDPMDPSGAEVVITLTDITANSFKATNELPFGLDNTVFTLASTPIEIIDPSDIPTEPEVPEEPEFDAGDYWILSGEMVAKPFEGTSWWYVENAVDGKGYKDNVFTFVAVEGGFNIKDANNNYYFVGEYNEGPSQKITSTQTLEDGYGVWSVEEQEDGTYKITDVKYNAWLQYTTYGNYGVYTEAMEGAVLPKLVDAQGATDRPEVESEFKSELEWSVSEDKKSYSHKANINSQGEVDVLKLGTSSAVGEATITVPAGTSKLSYWGVAWKGKQGEVTFTYGDNTVTQAYASNDGATSNSPYTITLAESDSYEITFSPALTADTVVTIASVSGKTRVILGGFVAE